jgi:hypothetical protein
LRREKNLQLILVLAALAAWPEACLQLSQNDRAQIDLLGLLLYG